MFTTYDIFDDVFKLRNMVDDFFKDNPASRNRALEYPYANVFEKNDQLEIRALVPGVVKEDLKIELNNNNVVIEGTRKNDTVDKPYIRKERTFGTFSKTIRLPYAVKQDAINASLKNGILSVTLEKSEEAKPKKIDIQ